MKCKNTAAATRPEGYSCTCAVHTQLAQLSYAVKISSMEGPGEGQHPAEGDVSRRRIRQLGPAWCVHTKTAAWLSIDRGAGVEEESQRQLQNASFTSKKLGAVDRYKYCCATLNQCCGESWKHICRGKACVPDNHMSLICSWNKHVVETNMSRRVYACC